MLTTIWLVLIIPVSLYFISSYMKPLEDGRNLRGLLAGIFGLAYAALHLRATYSIIFASLPHAAILFRIARGIVGGTWVTMLNSMGFPRATRKMLILAGILFAGLPLALTLYLHWKAPQVTLHFIFASPNLYPLEAWPVGIAISAVALLWLSGRNDGKSTGHDSGMGTAGHTAENGAGA
jgi:hypothetical protein